MPNIYTNPEITLTKQNNTVLTLSTLGKYVDQNVQMSLNAQSAAGTLSAAASSQAETTVATQGGTNVSDILGTKTTTEPSSGNFIRIKSTGTGDFTVTTPGWIATSPSQASGNETAYYPVTSGTASVSGTNTVTPSASVSGSNITLSNTNNGISVTAIGGGTASATASASATGSGYIESGDTLASQTIAAANQTTTASSYISGVTLGIPQTGTNSFTITLPNGSEGTLMLTFTVDTSGNWVVE